jgi:hypothetical protein
MLERAVMVYAMGYFMSRVITLTEESANRVVTQLRSPPEMSYLPTITAKLINLQMKQPMQELLDEEVGALLTDLDDLFLKSTRTKASWTESFSAVLILLMCIEAVQTASDGHASTVLSRNKSDAANLSRPAMCQQLDNTLFAHLKDEFHTFYKSHRTRTGQRNEIGFNPLRHGLEIDRDDGTTQEMRELVNQIKQIRTRYGKLNVSVSATELTGVLGTYMSENSKKLFDLHPDLLTDHVAFRKRNSGRLVLLFLNSFFENRR